MPKGNEFKKEVLRMSTEIKFLEFLIKKENASENTFNFLLNENYNIPDQYKEVYSLFLKENKEVIDKNSSDFEAVLEANEEDTKTYIPQMKSKLETTIKDMEDAVENLKNQKVEDEKKLKEMSKLLSETKKSLASVKEDNTALGLFVKMTWTLIKAAMAMAIIILGPIAIYALASIVAGIAATGIPLMTALTTSSMLAVVGSGIGGIIASTVLIWKFVLGAIALIGIVIALARKYKSEEAMTEKEKVIAVKQLEVKAKEVEKIINKVKSK